MSLLRPNFVCATLLCVAMPYAVAQHSPWYVVPQIGVVNADNDRGDDVDNGVMGVLSVGRELGEHFALEARLAGFTLNSAEDDRRTEQANFGIDAHWYPLGRLTPQTDIKPYLLLGAGYASSDIGDNFSSDNATATAGFGALISLWKTGLALRAEGRYATDFVDADDVSSFSDWQGSLGVQIPLGRGTTETSASPAVVQPAAIENEPVKPRAKPAAKPSKPTTESAAQQTDNSETAKPVTLARATDTDNDGIRDSLDRCADTASGQYVGEDGCALTISGAAPEPIAPPIVDTSIIQQPEAKPDADDAQAIAATATKAKPPSLPEANNSDAIMRLNGVTFKPGSSQLTKESFAPIQRIATLLEKQPKLTVEISGHTDNSGNANNNLLLSHARANAVKNALIDEGISLRRLSAKGYGDSKPIADNQLAAGRAKNRRIELLINRPE